MCIVSTPRPINPSVVARCLQQDGSGNADPPDLRRIDLEFDAAGNEQHSEGIDSERPAAVAVEAVAWPGRLCYLQVALRQAVPAARVATVADSISMVLCHANIGAGSIESVRVYYSVSKTSREAAYELTQKLQDEMQASWAPIFVPAVAAGSSPAADAALLVVMLAMEKPCVEI